MTSVRERRDRYPCSVCDKPCKPRPSSQEGSVECSQCRAWMHTRCLSLSEEDIRFFCQDGILFLCKRCFGVQGPMSCDWEVLLHRLKHDWKRNTACSISKLLDVYGVSPECSDMHYPFDSMPGEEDATSVAILQQFHEIMLERFSPRSTQADGNCCFRSVSLLLFGTEEQHEFVRLKTALEMLMHPQSYTLRSPYFVMDDRREPPANLPHLLKSVTTLGLDIELLHIYAISAAFNISIQSYIPPSHYFGGYSSPYNKIIYGRGVAKTAEPFAALMWTMVNLPEWDNEFRPGHIVPLMIKYRPDLEEESERSLSDSAGGEQEDIIEIADELNGRDLIDKAAAQLDSDNDSLLPDLDDAEGSGMHRENLDSPESTRQESPDADVVEVSDLDSVGNFDEHAKGRNIAGDSHQECTRANVVGAQDEDIEPDSDIDQSGESDHGPGMHDERLQSPPYDPEMGRHNLCQAEDTVGSEVESSHDTEGMLSCPEGMLALGSDFHSCDQLLQFLTNDTRATILDRIPRGKKSNVYCFINNSENVQRRSSGKRSVFDDDCGVWNSSKGNTTNSIHQRCENGKMKRLYLYKGKYCDQRRVDGKTVYIQLSAQPDPISIIKLCRYYTVLKGNEGYRKRVSWIESCADARPIAIVEYLGRSERVQPHGRSKAKNIEPYLRTAQVTLDRIQAEVKGRATNTEIYSKACRNAEEIDAPRNTRVVENSRYREARRERVKQGYSSVGNFCDEILSVLSKISSKDDFIQSATLTSERVPMIILYFQRQIDELKSFCFDRDQGSVLSCDKTYNLGSMYVTLTVYRNLSLVRAGTDRIPLFIGPIFIHGNSDFETYCTFMCHLSAKLHGCSFSELRIGSDDERAIRNSLEHAFPGSLSVYCTRHLRQNVLDKINKLTATNSIKTACRRLVEQIFSKEGLASCNDEIVFDAKMRQIQESYVDIPPELQDYVDNRIEPLLRQNMEAGCGGWTNNACESANHMVKKSTQWRRQHIPELINTLRRMVEDQYKEADRALIGTGNFRLKPSLQANCPTLEQWTSMSETQKQRLRVRYFTVNALCGGSRQRVTSLDGNLTVNYRPGAGKKPHQKRRRAAERSTSCKKDSSDEGVKHAGSNADGRCPIDHA